jgi:hypothetical protein
MSQSIAKVRRAIMKGQNFTTTFSVDQTPEEAFAAINNVRGWWSGDIEGCTDKVGEEFTYRYPGAHRSTQKITELVPGQRVVWRVVDSHLVGPEDPSEWTGTEITFDISRQGARTEVRFAHVGLVPDFECFDSCSNAWGFYVNASLRRLIATGEGPAAPPWA